MTRTQGLPVDPSRVLWPLGLGTALSLMGDASLYAVLPTHTSDAGVTLGSVGVLLGANRAIRLLLNGPAGLAYDRYPRRYLFVPSLLIGALSTALYAATHGFWPLLVARLLWGLAWSGIWVGGATMILDVAASEERGRWTGLYQTWFFLGTTAGSLSGGFLTDRLGYAATMWIGAALTALGGLAALAFLPETRGARRPAPRTALAATDAGQLTLGGNGALWAAVLQQGVSRFVGAGVLSAILGLIVRDLLQPFALGLGIATLTGILAAGRTILSMAAAPLGGTVSDRLGSRWGVMAWAVAAGLVGMLLMAWGTPATIVAGVLLGAASAGCVQSLATTLTGDLVSPRHRGRAIGLLHTAGDLGSAIGPIVAYALLPWLDLRGVYLLCALVLAASLVPALQLRSREMAPHDSSTAQP